MIYPKWLTTTYICIYLTNTLLITLIWLASLYIYPSNYLIDNDLLLPLLLLSLHVYRSFLWIYFYFVSYWVGRFLETRIYLNFEVWFLNNWDIKWRFIAKDLAYMINPNWTNSLLFNSSSFHTWFSTRTLPRKTKNMFIYWVVDTYESFLTWLSNK